MTTPPAPLLLDTSVVSLFFKKNDTRAPLYLPDLQGKLLAISFVTVAELKRWVISRRWGQTRIDEIDRRLRLMVTLPYTDAVALQWARIQADTPRSENDAWIAACALAYGLTLVTDDKGFEGIRGLTIISHHSEDPS